MAAMFQKLRGGSSRAQIAGHGFHIFFLLFVLVVQLLQHDRIADSWGQPLGWSAGAAALACLGSAVLFRLRDGKPVRPERPQSPQPAKTVTDRLVDERQSVSQWELAML